MKYKVKVLLLLVLSGLLLGVSPVSRLYSANDEPVHASGHERIESASVQFILVHVERETLNELMDESNVPTLDAISLEKIGRYIHNEDGAEIVSQTKLSVLDGHEAEMTVVDNERHKAKNADEEKGQQEQREVEVFVRIRAEIQDDTLFADFAYKRGVAEETFYTGEKAEEEEGREQKFEISSGIVLHAGQGCIAGAHLNEGLARLLIMKADLK